MQTGQRQTEKLCFIHGNRLLFFSPDQIIRLEAASNYTYVHFMNHTPILMAKVLHQYEQLLKPFGFIRTHKSHLVNIIYIAEFHHNGMVLMRDDSKAEVSRRKKHDVFKALVNKIQAPSKNLLQ
jgi:two-component system LytT family response regulator